MSRREGAPTEMVAWYQVFSVILHTLFKTPEGWNQRMTNEYSDSISAVSASSAVDSCESYQGCQLIKKWS